MAVDGDTNTGRELLLLCARAIACASPVRAEAPSGPADGRSLAPYEHTSTSTRVWWREGATRLQALLQIPRLRTSRKDEPEWLRRSSGAELVEAPMAADDGAVCLVLQDDRPDGTDLLTARYTMHDRGALKAYAGAGLNRAQYFHDDPSDPGPTWFNKRNRRTSMGPAAELGAEVQVSPRVRLNADIRWIDLDGRAEALRTDQGPVSAEPVMVGLSIGYRFR
ncbi:MAG: ompW [Steroidobacteraceae bacterium]|nr:ompW [Steroidobacteraceae bacterium]